MPLDPQWEQMRADNQLAAYDASVTAEALGINPHLYMMIEDLGFLIKAFGVSGRQYVIAQQRHAIDQYDDQDLLRAREDYECARAQMYGRLQDLAVCIRLESNFPKREYPSYPTPKETMD